MKKQASITTNNIKDVLSHPVYPSIFYTAIRFQSNYFALSNQCNNIKNATQFSVGQLTKFSTTV